MIFRRDLVSNPEHQQEHCEGKLPHSPHKGTHDR